VRKTERGTSGGAALLPLLLALESLHFVFARLAHDVLDPRISILYAMAIATTAVGVYGAITRTLSFAVGWAHRWLFVSIGALIALSTQINYIVIDYVDPGAASLLSQAATFYAIALGVLWLKERFTRWQAIGSLVAVVGAIIVALQPGDFFRIGSLMLLAGAFAYQLHAALVKRHGGGIDMVNFFFFRLLCVTLFLLAGTLFQAMFAPGAFAPGMSLIPDWRGLLIVMLIGLVDVVFSRTLYYRVLRAINVSLFAVVMTLSPVLTTLWTFLLFGVRPGLQQLIGGAVVLIGVLILALKRRSTARSSRE
jgi:drug/metabolite transporter (DMT)-like permease